VCALTNNYLYIRPAWLVRSFNNDPGCGKYKKVISLGVRQQMCKDLGILRFVPQRVPLLFSGRITLLNPHASCSG